MTGSSKTLAQWEIDALLGNLPGATQTGEFGRRDDRQVKAYDFRRPDKFAKDHLRALQLLHEAFAKYLGSALSSYLRTPVGVHLSTIEQVVYDEYISQLPIPTVVSIIGMSPLQGRLLLEFNLDLAFGMIERLLGGTGTWSRSARELTEIELALVRNLCRHTVGGIRECWSGVIAVEPTLEEIVLNPQIVRAALSGEAAAMLIFEVKLFDAAGTLSLCLPYATVEPVLERFSSQILMGQSRAKEWDHLDFRRPLRDVALPVAVELGRAQLALRDLASLEPGDVLRLDTGPDDLLTMLVSGRPKFYCRPGVHDGRMAAQVTSIIVDEELPDDRGTE